MKIAALVLAAGKSSRMGFNKLLADMGGKPMILRAVENISASKVDQIFVVTGHEAGKVELALKHTDAKFILNKDFSSGLASSVKAGIEHLGHFDGVLICLGDMPLVSAGIIDRMIGAYDSGRGLVFPIRKQTIGNPVLWGPKFFPDLMNLSGDRGARSLIEQHRRQATEILIDDEAICLDADTPEALAQIKSIAGF